MKHIGMYRVQPQYIEPGHGIPGHTVGNLTACLYILSSGRGVGVGEEQQANAKREVAGMVLRAE